MGASLLSGVNVPICDHSSPDLESIYYYKYVEGILRRRLIVDVERIPRSAPSIVRLPDLS